MLTYFVMTSSGKILSPYLYSDLNLNSTENALRIPIPGTSAVYTDYLITDSHILDSLHRVCELHVLALTQKPTVIKYKDFIDGIVVSWMHMDSRNAKVTIVFCFKFISVI